MNAIPFLSVIPLVISITGCNNNSASSPVTDYLGSPEGLYVNADTAAVMFIGTVNSELPIVISDMDYDSIYATKQVINTFPMITTKGVISWSDLGWINDDTTEFSIMIDETRADAISTIEETTVLYAFDKNPNSHSLEELSSGWLEAESNSYWQINADGTYRINPYDTCLFEGTLVESHGFYTSNDTVASGCTNQLLNGAYPQVRIATFVQHQNTHVVGVFIRDDVIMWDYFNDSTDN